MLKHINSFQIKILALIFMVFDHLHYFFAGIFNFPGWFSMIGRLSAPLFIFTLVNGMIHTKNPKKYLFRLWISSVFMGLGNELFNKYISLPNGGIIINNIFSTLFIIALYIFCIQQIKILKKHGKSFLVYIVIMLIPILSSIIIFLVISNLLFIGILRFILLFVPSIITSEGGIMLVILGVGLFLCNQNKKNIAIFYSIFCLIVLIIGFTPELGFYEGLLSMFVYNIQWMMIFSLPFMLLYNGKKGRNMKYFFYLFYPIHIYGFALLAYFISKI